VGIEAAEGGRMAAFVFRRVARERLGITPDEIDGGHTPALSRPHELADRLEAYAAGQGLILPVAGAPWPAAAG
jgi:hypothetical protein